jgi:multidrug efflux pump
MKFTDIFVRRWVLAMSVNLIILVMGLRAWSSMTVQEFPTLTSTVVTVSTSYPGADPETVQGFITSRLEQAIAQAPNIDYMTATSAESASSITVYMKLNTDPNAAVAQILAKVNQVSNQLPSQSEAPVITETIGNPIDLIYLRFYSTTLSQQQIDDYLLRVIQPQIQAINGVSQAQILPAGTESTGNSFALRAWLLPDKLAAYGLSAADVSTALLNNDAISAVGTTRGRNIQANIIANTSLKNIDQFKQLIVSYVKGVPIHLSDVANVELGAQTYTQSVAVDGIPATFIGVQLTPDANALTVADVVHQMLKTTIPEELPPGMQAGIAYDSSIYISTSIKEVEQTLAIAIGIVVVVVFGFLGAFRSLLIPAVAIPLAIIGAGIFMAAFGFTINLLTLLAVILAIGLVVDDAIIMLENIQRHIDEGMKPTQAALQGARELASPILIMSTTLAAVFTPIGIMGGLTGALFTEFAFTLVFTVLVSMVVALTLSPMMGSKILRTTPDHGLSRLLENGFHAIRRLYDWSLAVVLNFRWLVLIATAGFLVAIPFLVLGSPSELAPDEDQSIVLYSGTGPATATLHFMQTYSEQVNKIAHSFPECANVFQINGFSINTPGSNSILGGMLLKPWDERTRTQAQLQPLFQQKLGTLAGVNILTFGLPSIPGSTRGAPIQFVLQSTKGFADIDAAAQNLINAAMKSGKFMFLIKDLQYDNPQIDLVIDRNMVASLGLTMTDVTNDLQPLLGGNYINRFDMQGYSYQVIPQVPDELRADPNLLKDYYIRTASGTMVPLSTIARITHEVQPEFQPQFQEINSATLQGAPTPGVTMDEALSYLKTEAKTLLPTGYTFDYAGESRQYVQQGSGILISFMLAIILVFLMMAAQFESFRDPFIVMFTVPCSIFGAIIFLYFGMITHATLNIYTEVGLITLIGLITKQGILIVEFANQIMENEGLDRQAAVMKASSIRLRPILMTTASMVMGVVPLLIASGAGAVSRYDMGLMIFSGLSIGCLFSLYVVPVIYTYIATIKTKVVEAETQPHPAQTGGAEPHPA